MVLAMIGSTVSPMMLALILTLGACLSATAIVAIAGPIWLFCHYRGNRGPFAAALVGASIDFVLFFAGQVYGVPTTDTLAYRWLSGIATSAVLALFTGGIGLAMWRVAYRKV